MKKKVIMKKILKYCFNTTLWTPTKSEWVNLMSALNKEEQERILRYSLRHDCKQTLIGQLMIRTCLKSLLNVEWTHIQVDRNAKGRPYLKLKETLMLAKSSHQQQQQQQQQIDHQIDFNLSHSGDYCVIVAGLVQTITPMSHTSKKSSSNVSPDDCIPLSNEDNCSFKLGVDVMKIECRSATTALTDRHQPPHSAAVANTNDDNLYETELNRLERVINSKFSQAERNYIYNRPNPVEKLTAFYRLWCLKESYVKALGDGVRFDLTRLEFTISSELLVDLNSRKCLVVNDTKLHVDAKLDKCAKFYEQYFLNNSNPHQTRPQLNVMTVCLVDKDTKSDKNTKSGASSSSTAAAAAAAATDQWNLNDEFKEIFIKDIVNQIPPLDNVDVDKSDEFNELWQKYCDKS